jgi:hypothetical protein
MRALGKSAREPDRAASPHLLELPFPMRNCPSLGGGGKGQNGMLPGVDGTKVEPTRRPARQTGVTCTSSGTCPRPALEDERRIVEPAEKSLAAGVIGVWPTGIATCSGADVPGTRAREQPGGRTTSLMM